MDATGTEGALRLSSTRGLLDQLRRPPAALRPAFLAVGRTRRLQYAPIAGRHLATRRSPGSQFKLVGHRPVHHVCTPVGSFYARDVPPRCCYVVYTSAMGHVLPKKPTKNQSHLIFTHIAQSKKKGKKKEQSTRRITYLKICPVAAFC